MSKQWGKMARELERYLRLKSFPVAMRMLETVEELKKVPYLRRPAKPATMCQLITQVKNFDWTVGADANDLIFSTCGSILGFNPVDPRGLDGTFRSIVWTRTKKDAAACEAAIERLPLGKYRAVAMAPLAYDPFEPHLVLVYANPAQTIVLINALQFEDYQVMDFHCVGESSCSDAIARAFNQGRPFVSIPCYGERRYGHAADDELVTAIPAAHLEKAVRGLATLYRRGVRYPISQSGAEADPAPAFPPAYHTFAGVVEDIRGDKNRLVVGLTGSIACGKSTVAKMLVELGAHLIDFDQLARKVVEPGQPAYQDIVDYFGRQILDQDGNLDRDKMRQVVFNDLEKRKTLEGFTHPRINGEFLAEIERISREDPAPVIVADVPLLVEVNLGFMFDRIVSVYLDEEAQLKRLIERNGFSEQEARKIMASQIPPAEKAGYADLVIDNGGSLEQTRARVNEVWEALVKARALKNAA